MSFSFPKESRLLNSQDFNYLRRGAQVISTPFLRLYYKKSRIEGDSRLGLSVSKKAGNAVRRNLIKRKIREGFRLSELHSKNLDILVVASARLKKLDNKDELRKAIDSSWKNVLSRDFRIK